MEEIKNWLNSNIGVLNVIIFFSTLAVGFLSGIFKSIVKRPRFNIRIIPKMTYGSVFLTGEKHTPPKFGTYDVHKTAFVVYLEITNRGTADSSIGKIRVGYYKDDGKRKLFQKRLWIKESNILDLFAIPTGDEKSLVTPNLRQVNPETEDRYSGFLRIGNSKNGTCYFEQSSSWGNHYPRRDENGNTELKIEIKDAFGNKYKKKFKVPIVNFDKAIRYNPKFGMTHFLLDKDVKDIIGNQEKENIGGETSE